jgi:hypothetical protein
VIPAPLPLLETLSKLFNRNAVRGCQQFSMNLYISKMPPSWLKTKWQLALESTVMHISDPYKSRVIS